MVNKIKYNKKGKFFGLIGILIFIFSIFTSTQIINLMNNSEDNEINRDIVLEDLFTSASLGQIKIYHDSAFILANGVRSGTGTKGDPYIISNWNINSPVSGFCIEIVNTTSYFEIRDCTFSNGVIGIMLQNVTNGKVFNNTFQGFNSTGVGVVESKQINITDNVISNIYGTNGSDGADGTIGAPPTSGTIGTDGGGVSGIYTSNSSFLSISYNKISDVQGGSGGNGGGGGDWLPDNPWKAATVGANGGIGGSGIGIIVESSNHSIIFNNNIQGVFGGIGGSGGSGGLGSEMETIEEWGGDGGASGAGGRGGNVIGIFVDPSYNISTYYNNISNLFGGLGGDSKTAGNGGLGNGWWCGGGRGADGNEGGEGGFASGMLFDNVKGTVNSRNKIWNIFGGNGGNGGNGGKGGDVTDKEDTMAGWGGWGGMSGPGGYSYGLYFKNSQDLNNSLNIIDNVIGGNGGNGGNGGQGGACNEISVFTNMGGGGGWGNEGGDGGWGLGIYYDSSNNSNNEKNTISNIIGGFGGLGGNSSDGKNAAGDGMGMGGGDGGWSGAGGDGGSGVGIFASFSININSTLNKVVNIMGANGNMAGSAGSGGTGLRDSGGHGGTGGNGGNGGDASGLQFANCQYINNQLNDISLIIAGDGASGSNGGDGGDGDLQDIGQGNGGGGGNGGNGGNGGAAYGLNVTLTNFILCNGNSFVNIKGGNGVDGSNGRDGGNSFIQSGGDSGSGGNGGDSKEGIAMYYSGSNNITNILNILSNASAEYGGIKGSPGIPGTGGTPGSLGAQGTTGQNSTAYGFYYINSESSGSWQNEIYILNNTDIDGNYNKWNSSNIGNFWSYYTGLDILSPFGIGDLSYNLTGTSESKDWLPIVDSSAPNVILNKPTSLQVFTERNSVLINVTIIDDLSIIYAKAMIKSQTPFNLTLTKAGSNNWFATWDNLNQYPIMNYNITIYAKDWKNNLNNTEWVVIQYVDLTPPQVLINTPINGSSFEPPGNLSISFSVNVTDTYGITSVIAHINASTPLNISLTSFIDSNYQLSWNNYTDLTYPPGDYRINFIATDNYGNVNNTEFVIITVVKDLVGPNIVLNSPTNQSVHRTPLNISVFVDDPEGNTPNAGDVIATIYNETMAPFNLTLTNTLLNQWDVVWSNLTTTYYPGNYYITITAYDSSHYHNINQSVGFLNISFAYDEMDDENDDSKLNLSNIISFITSTTGMITIGVGAALVAAVIVIIKIRGHYKPSSKQKMKTEQYRIIFRRYEND